MRLHLWTQQYLENIGPSKDSSYISKPGSKNHYFFSNSNLVLSLSYKEIHIFDSFIQPLPVISISWKLLGGLWWGIYPPAKTWKFMIVQILKSNVKVRFPNLILMPAGEPDQTGTSRDDNDHFSLITLMWDIRWAICLFCVFWFARRGIHLYIRLNFFGSKFI